MEQLVYSRPHLSSFLLPISTNYRLMIPSSKGTLPQKANKFIMCASQQQVSSEPIIEKRRSSSAYYKPNVRSYEMLKSLDNTHDAVEGQDERMQVLEKEVRNALIHGYDNDTLAVLELIDDICKLGLSYRFEEDIENTLQSLPPIEQNINGRLEDILHVVSLNFRLRRQHGLDASQDAFQRFMDSQGNFMDSLQGDVQGMLSLYEASHLATEGEHLLHEAKAFATEQLRCSDEYIIGGDLKEQVNYALELPLHRRIPLLNSPRYIKAYSRKPNADRRLLELAVLDFNRMQSIYKKDLKIFFRWWESISLTKNLSFTRDRPVEYFSLALGVAQHPKLSNCRGHLSKLTAFIAIIDDIYDIYGLPDELKMFTSAVERWDINSMNDLPEYMKLCFLALYNTVNEIGYHVLNEHGHGVNIIPYLAKSWADLFKAFLVEAKWCRDKSTPKFGEYLENGRVSIAAHVLLVHSYFLITPTVTKEAIESLQNYDDVLPWPPTIIRLRNDLASSSAESERGETANSISCYMMEMGASEEDAREHINELTDMSWRKLNEYQGRGNSKFDKSFLQIAFNLARMGHLTYDDGDALGNPDAKSNKDVHSLIFKPISLDE